MQKNNTFQYFDYSSKASLKASSQDLVTATIEFSQQAYAPYSNFRVSAGIKLDSGEMLFGTNVENASYPVGTCAERNVLAHVMSNHPKSTIVEMAIYVDKDLPDPVPPCGMCRQAIAEAAVHQKKDFPILLIGKNGRIIVIPESMNLLPLSFDRSFLK